MSKIFPAFFWKIFDLVVKILLNLSTRLYSRKVFFWERTVFESISDVERQVFGHPPKSFGGPSKLHFNCPQVFSEEN